MTSETVRHDTREERVRGLAESVLPDASVFVLDVRVHGHGKGTRVEVVLDGERGVTVEQCADVSRELAFSLNVKEVFEGDYRLTVSSPGADSPLVDRRQYSKNVGRTLVVHTGLEKDEEPPLVGRLTEVDDTGFKLETQEGDRRVEYGDVVRATVKLPW